MMSNEKELKVICGFCGGVGSLTLRKGTQTCVVCKGKGILFFQYPVNVCPKCHGAGKIGWLRRCTDCKATGWVKK